MKITSLQYFIEVKETIRTFWLAGRHFAIDASSSVVDGQFDYRINAGYENRIVLIMRGIWNVNLSPLALTCG